MAVGLKRFNWTRSATGWEQFQAWQERRRAMRDDFDMANSVAVNGFATAWSDRIAGASDLAAKAAQARVAAAIKTRIDQMA